MSEEETPPTDTDEGLTIRLVDNIEDQDLKQTMKAILQQNSEMSQQNKEMKDIITKQETERELAKFEKAREEKLGALEKLHPALAKKHSKTTDLGILQTAIDTAEAVKGNFPEYESEKAKDKASTSKQYVAPKMYRPT